MPAKSPRTLTTIGLGAVLLLAAVMLLGRAMDAPLDRDESMYVSAAVLARSAALYAEVPFLQMPGLPWLLAAFLPAPGEGPLLLCARLLTVGCAIAMLLALVGIARRRGASPWFGVALAVLLAVQPTFLAAADEATNHLPPLAAATVAVWLLAGTQRSRRDTISAGVLLGLAVALRLTWAPVVLATWIVFGLVTRERTSVAWIGGGGLLVALPVLVAASAAPDAFAFQNLGFHAVNRSWAIDTGLPWALGRRALFDALVDLAQQRAVLAWLLALGVTAAITRWTRQRLIVALLVGAALAVASALPSPWWARHALPLIGGLTVLAALASPRELPHPRIVGGLLLIASASGILAQGGTHAEAVARAFEPSSWSARIFHEQCQLLRKAAPEGPITSLRPLVLLEAGLEIDPTSVAGPFVWRTRAHLDPTQVEAARGAQGVLDLEPAPAGVLLGVEPRYEGNVRGELEAAGFEAVGEGPDGAELWAPIKSSSS